MDELDFNNLIPLIIDLFIFSKKDTFSAQGFTYNLATIHMLSLSLSALWKKRWWAENLKFSNLHWDILLILSVIQPVCVPSHGNLHCLLRKSAINLLTSFPYWESQLKMTN